MQAEVSYLTSVGKGHVAAGGREVNCFKENPKMGFLQNNKNASELNKKKLYGMLTASKILIKVQSIEVQ